MSNKPSFFSELKRRNVYKGQAQIATQAHAPDLALQVIEQLMAVPSGDVMSIERLRLDPVWAPLREGPRFQMLRTRYGAEAGAAK